MTDEEEFTDQEWTYIGVRISNNKKYHVWLSPSGDDKWYSKAGTGMLVGGIYKVNANADGSKAGVKNARYQRASESEDRPKWDTEHRAAMAWVDSQAQITRLRREKPIGDLTLRELGELYHNSVGSRKPAVLATAMSYITGYTGD